MTYRELIKLYKTGKLDENQKEKVAKDIERQEAISEYLFDEGEIPGFNDLENENYKSIYGEDGIAQDDILDKMTDEEKQFSKLIKASIRKAFVKMGVIVGTVVIAVVLFIIFVLPKLVDCFYYNPLEVAGKEKEYGSYIVGDEEGNIVEEVTSDTEYEIRTTDRLSLDMAVYSELFLPGDYADNVISDSRGYGVYDIVIHGAGYSHPKNVAGKIDKNKMILYDINTYSSPVVNIVLPQLAGVDYSFHEDWGAEDKEYMLESLQNLEDNKLYGVYVTFSDVYSYSELKQWSDENTTIEPYWCALCKKLDERQIDPLEGLQYRADELMGFVNRSSARQLFYDKNQYPNLTQFDLSLTTSEEKDWEITEEDMTTHVISTLRYMQGQKAFNEMMGIEHYIEGGTYQDMIDSIEKNGLIIYGYYGVGTKEDILALSKLEEIACIYTDVVE